MVVGIITSLISLSLPFLGGNPELLSSGGQIAAAIAGIFGLAVASIALMAYVYSESYEKQFVDSVWDSLLRLWAAFDLAAYLNRSIVVNKKDGVITAPQADDLLKKLKEKLIEQMDSSLDGRLVTYLQHHYFELAHKLATLRILLDVDLLLNKHCSLTPFLEVCNNLNELKTKIRKSSILPVESRKFDNIAKAKN